MMGDFFSGWQRKTGCVTLLMACLIAGMWMRSWAVLDHLMMPINDRCWSIASVNGVILWLSRDSTLEPIDMLMRKASVYKDELEVTDAELLDTSRFMRNGLRPRQFKVAYWSVVLPLTLGSACLIVWKPRKKSSPPVVELMDVTHILEGEAPAEP